MAPNVLFIMADQHRHDWLGAAGADFLRTPNLDRLAGRGVRFTQCCTNAPVCVPARIGLATGLQPSRLGSMDNDSLLPVGVVTYYQRLRDNGYRVGCVGKLDLNKPDPYVGRNGDLPRTYQCGFTHPMETEGKMNAGTSPTPRGPYGFYLQDKGLFDRFRDDYALRRSRGWRVGVSHDSVLATEDFADSFIGRHAAEWISEVQDDAPWHLFVSFVGPHDPFDPPTEYADRYRNAHVPPPIGDGMEGKPGWVARRREPATAAQVAETRRQYSAAVELIDAEVGRVLSAVERRGMADNTVVIYCSDHGEMLGDHGLYHKSCAYEPALRVPLIIAGPGVAGGRVSDVPVELIDLNPTVCELAGLPPQERIDGLSVGGVLGGEGHTHRSETVFALRNFRGVRAAGWKYIENVNDVAELYDLAADPRELHNLAESQPHRCRELRALLDSRFAGCPGRAPGRKQGPA